MGGRFSLPEIWTVRQRIVVAGGLVGLLCLLSVRYYVNPCREINSVTNSHRLVVRIDPNTAEWMTLAELPELGEKRAREIVAYRERYQLEHAGGCAFSRLEDLLKIKGVGYAMMRNLQPYLVFPATGSVQGGKLEDDVKNPKLEIGNPKE